jgi:hypothetical protein
VLRASQGTGKAEHQPFFPDDTPACSQPSSWLPSYLSLPLPFSSSSSWSSLSDSLLDSPEPLSLLLLLSDSLSDSGSVEGQCWAALLTGKSLNLQQVLQFLASDSTLKQKPL